MGLLQETSWEKGQAGSSCLGGFSFSCPPALVALSGN